MRPRSCSTAWSSFAAAKLGRGDPSPVGQHDPQQLTVGVTGLGHHPHRHRREQVAQGVIIQQGQMQVDIAPHVQRRLVGDGAGDLGGRPGWKTGMGLAFQQVPDYAEPTWPEGPRPQMLHLDSHVATVAVLELQRRRALDLGARELLDRSADPEEPLYVLADPVGHPFCIFVG